MTTNRLTSYKPARWRATAAVLAATAGETIKPIPPQEARSRQPGEPVENAGLATCKSTAVGLPSTPRTGPSACPPPAPPGVKTVAQNRRYTGDRRSDHYPSAV